MEPRFDMAALATFRFHGVKIVVTRDNDINLAEERQLAFENADEAYEETP